MREIDGSANNLQDKIEAMRIRDDYEEQNKIECLNERPVAEDLAVRSAKEAVADFSLIN